MIKSPLKWAGGKTALLPKIQKIWKNYEDHCWVDLFGGSCVLPLNLQPTQAIVNDSNSHLINFWKWVQTEGFSKIQFNTSEKSYYRLRELFNCKPQPELFYYLNKVGFRGLCRYNSKGEFNVPFGYYKNPNVQLMFLKQKQIVKNWQFVNEDFQKIQIPINGLVFADPPYFETFTNYTKENFTWSNQVLIAEKLAQLDNPVIACNSWNDQIVNLYSTLGFKVEKITMPRSISIDGDRQPVFELFATKNI